MSDIQYGYITVAVMTYNSEKTIVATLESIKKQTYPYLDIFINDDCSKDKTKDIIIQWLNNNKKRFRFNYFNVSKKNKGISKTFDYVMRHSNNPWCKCIAGDDLLEKDCIEKNLSFVKKYGVDTIVYSKHRPFVEKNSKIEIKKASLYDESYLLKIGRLKPRKQYKKLLMQDIVYSPTVFINVLKYKSLGGIDLRIKNIEDWPLRLLYSKAEEKIYVMNEYTVLYRLGDSLSHSTRTIYNINHLKQKKLMKELLIYPNIPKYHIVYYFGELMNDLRCRIIIHVFKNNCTRFAKVINKALMICEPSKWKKFFYSFCYMFRK